MLRFNVNNVRERLQLEHAHGPLEFGRGPKRGNIARCMVQDGYVSKDHVRVEASPTGEIRVDNLSTKQPIVIAVGAIPPGGWAMLHPPMRLGIGDTPGPAISDRAVGCQRAEVAPSCDVTGAHLDFEPRSREGAPPELEPLGVISEDAEVAGA